MADLRRGAAIVGIHEHITRYAPDKSELQIQGESVVKALEDAGLTKKDVDGLLTASSRASDSALNLADYLDMYPDYLDNTNVGGASFEFHSGPRLERHRNGPDQLRRHHLQRHDSLGRSFHGHWLGRVDASGPGAVSGQLRVPVRHHYRGPLRIDCPAAHAPIRHKAGTLG